MAIVGMSVAVIVVMAMVVPIVVVGVIMLRVCCHVSREFLTFPPHFILKGKEIERMKFILVTGISRGLGAALAARLVQQHDVSVIGTTRTGAPFAHERLHVVHDDVARPGNDFSALREALAGIRLHAVVNNAATLLNKPFGGYTAQDLEQQFRTNVFAPFLLLQSLEPYLQAGSHVVNIGSMGGYQGSTKFAGLSAYSAGKGALAVFTECLAEEWNAKGIRVNCLALGSVNTEMLAEAFPGYTAPLNPDQMADFVARFTLDGHSFFNGKILPVSITVP